MRLWLMRTNNVSNGDSISDLGHREMTERYGHISNWYTTIIASTLRKAFVTMRYHQSLVRNLTFSRPKLTNSDPATSTVTFGIYRSVCRQQCPKTVRHCPVAKFPVSFNRGVERGTSFYKLRPYSYTCQMLSTDASCGNISTVNRHVSSSAHQALEEGRIRSQERPIV